MWRLVEAGDFRVDADTFRVTVRSRQIRLTPKEFKFMLYLAKHPSRIVAHDKLALAIWGTSEKGARERLRVLVQQVREKIESAGSPTYIVTEPWIGYRFEPRGEMSSIARLSDQASPLPADRVAHI